VNNGRTTVIVKRGDTKTVVEVRTGRVGTAGTEITDGLSEGDVLVLPATAAAASDSVLGLGLDGGAPPGAGPSGSRS
jgi:hypothetical protein